MTYDSLIEISARIIIVSCLIINFDARFNTPGFHSNRHNPYPGAPYPLGDSRLNLYHGKGDQPSHVTTTLKRLRDILSLAQLISGKHILRYSLEGKVFSSLIHSAIIGRNVNQAKENAWVILITWSYTGRVFLNVMKKAQTVSETLK